MLIEAPEPHRCTMPEITTYYDKPLTLPDKTETTYRTVGRTLQVGSLYKCEECDQRWIVTDGDWGNYWTRLKWYHRTTAPQELTPREQRRRAARGQALMMLLLTFLVFSFLAFLMLMIYVGGTP